MATFPLDTEALFMEFPEVRRGLQTMRTPITTESQLQKICQLKNDSIYDYVGIKEVFEYSARKHEEKGAGTYAGHLEKLERYMTAHLLLLHIYSENQNLTEAPDMTHFGKMNAEGMNRDMSRGGYITSILQGSNIGQKIQAMLYLNVNNVGGLL